MSELLPIIDWEQHAQPDDATANMAKELLGLFSQQLPELQEKLKQAAAAQDVVALEATLHRLQGACAYCGLPRLRKIVAANELALRQIKQLDPQQLALIMQEIIVVKEELARHGIGQ
jgi:two-component system sensor histidine kinase BarA